MRGASLLKAVSTNLVLTILRAQLIYCCVHNTRLIIRNEAYFDTKGYSLDNAWAIPEFPSDFPPPPYTEEFNATTAATTTTSATTTTTTTATTSATPPPDPLAGDEAALAKIMGIDSTTQILPKGMIKFSSQFEFGNGDVTDVENVLEKPDFTLMPPDRTTADPKCLLLVVNADYPFRPQTDTSERFSLVWAVEAPCQDSQSAKELHPWNVEKVIGKSTGSGHRLVFLTFELPEDQDVTDIASYINNKQFNIDKFHTDKNLGPALYRTVLILRDRIAGACGKAQVESSKIIQGEAVDPPHSIPWQARLKCKNTSPTVCGASVVSPIHVLTSARCAMELEEKCKGIQNIEVIVGEHNVTVNEGKTLQVECSLVHEDFSEPQDPQTLLLNDIAVLTLKDQVVFDDKVERVCLMSEEIEKVNIITASPPPPVTISGWGLMNDSDVLQKADIPFVSTEKDKCKWDTDFAGRLCAGDLKDSGVRAGACVGDIGGPLTWKDGDGSHYLLGVTSFVPARKTAEVFGIKDSTCGNPAYPDVFTRITSFRDWLEKKGVTDSGFINTCSDHVPASPPSQTKSTMSITTATTTNTTTMTTTTTTTTTETTTTTTTTEEEAGRGRKPAKKSPPEGDLEACSGPAKNSPVKGCSMNGRYLGVCANPGNGTSDVVVVGEGEGGAKCLACIDDDTNGNCDTGCYPKEGPAASTKSICWASEIGYKNDGKGSTVAVNSTGRCVGCVDSKETTGKDDGCEDAAPICTASDDLTGEGVLKRADYLSDKATNKTGDECKKCLHLFGPAENSLVLGCSINGRYLGVCTNPGNGTSDVVVGVGEGGAKCLACIDDDINGNRDTGCYPREGPAASTKSICWASQIGYKNDGKGSAVAVNSIERCVGCVDSKETTGKDDGCEEAAPICTASDDLTGEGVLKRADYLSDKATNKTGDECKKCVHLFDTFAPGDKDLGCDEERTKDFSEKSLCVDGKCEICIDSAMQGNNNEGPPDKGCQAWGPGSKSICYTTTIDEPSQFTNEGEGAPGLRCVVCIGRKEVEGADDRIDIGCSDTKPVCRNAEDLDAGEKQPGDQCAELPSKQHPRYKHVMGLATNYDD